MTPSFNYPHPRLNTPITAIGGHYMLTGENRLPYRDREVLYLTGMAVFDTSCCGTGGASYATVPGFIEKWKYEKDETGQVVSAVTPVTDPADQAAIRKLIKQREQVLQIDFH
ncbi:MAG: hypothetical protein SWH68_08365 [Thermodesulfobacteriota bacterium]|nr:hypothetical protein [Thermodesulfobacteriota bacterium]